MRFGRKGDNMTTTTKKKKQQSTTDYREIREAVAGAVATH